MGGFFYIGQSDYSFLYNILISFMFQPSLDQGLLGAKGII